VSKKDEGERKTWAKEVLKRLRLAIKLARLRGGVSAIDPEGKNTDARKSKATNEREKCLGEAQTCIHGHIVSLAETSDAVGSPITEE
jgi:hypothetical protein